MIEKLTKKVLNGEQITKEEALNLVKMPLEELCGAADKIRRQFCKDKFDMCTIINGKSGKCSEDCKYCAQSAHYHTGAGVYPLLPAEEIIKQAEYHAQKGVLRYSIVTSGRCLNDKEVDEMCRTIRKIKETVDIEVCISFGILKEEQYKRIKEAGATRVHNNLETSRRNFPNVCTTHSFEDKVKATKAAMRAGLSVCSGGIMGLGETWEDRIDMAVSLRKLGVRSVPINLLNPIPGTPYEKNEKISDEEMRRIIAIYRLLLPEASIRLAGGRGLMEDKGRACFLSGANAVISGDMLTTSGYTIESDCQILEELGYQLELWNG